jgi:hypothetical protein
LNSRLQHALPDDPGIPGDRLTFIDLVKQRAQLAGESDDFGCHGEADLLMFTVAL